MIVIDRFDYRLKKTAEHTGAETINYADVDAADALNELTAGRGPDACIDAVGMEAHHGNPAVHAYDRVKQATRQETERAHARPGGDPGLPHRRDRLDHRRVRRAAWTSSRSAR